MLRVEKRGQHFRGYFRYKGHKYRPTFQVTNKRLAEELLYKFFERVVKGETGLECDILYKKFKAEFLEFQMKEHRETTYKRHRDVLTNFSKFLGQKEDYLLLKDIHRNLINTYKHKRMQDNVSLFTINLEIRGIRSFLTEAKKRNYTVDMTYKDVAFVDTPDISYKKIDAEKIDHIIREAKIKYPNRIIDSFTAMLITYIYTGARKMELVDLKWSQVDFDHNCLTLCSEGRRSKRKAKTRTIFMHPEIKRELNLLPRTKEHVFLSPNGVPYKFRFYRKFKILVRSLGYELDIYDLRHNLGTYLQEKGVSFQTIAKILGHTNISTTFKYQHTAPSDVQAAIELMQGVKNEH